MPKFPIKDRNLIQGISQQAAESRLPGQLEDCVNCWPSPIEGLGKRPPTSHHSRVATDWFRDAMVHQIDRDDFEQYQIIFQHKTVKIYDNAGVEIPLVSLASGNNLIVSQHDMFDGTFDIGQNYESFTGKRDAIENADKSGMADLIEWTDNAANGDNDLVRKVAVADVTSSREYVVRADVKLGSRRDSSSPQDVTCGWRVQYVGGNPLNWHYIDFDIDTGTVNLPLTNNITRSKITDLKNGWWRCEFVWTANGTELGVASEVEIEFYPATDLTGSSNGYGGAYIDNYSCIDLDSTDILEYLDIEEENNVPDPKTLSSWLNTNGPAPSSSSDVGPYGYSTWVDIGVNASQATGTYDTNGAVDEFVEGWNLLYLFTQESSSDDIDSLRFGWLDTTNTKYHRALFTWNSGVLEATSVDDEVFKSGVIDLGNGVYQPWLAVNTQSASTTSGGDSRAIYIYANKAAAAAGTTQVWGVRQVNGVDHPSKAPYIDPRKRIRATTVADRTFVSNGRKTVRMTDYTTPPQVDDVQFIFVKRGEFERDYLVTIQLHDEAYTVGLQTTSEAGSATKTDGFAHWYLNTFNPIEGGLYDIDFTSTTSPTAGTYNLNTNLPNDLGKHQQRNAARFMAQSIRKIWDPANNNQNTLAAYNTGNATCHIKNTRRGDDLTVTINLQPGGSNFSLQEVTDPSGARTGYLLHDIQLTSIAAVIAEKLEDITGTGNAGTTDVECDVSGHIIRVYTNDGTAIKDLQVATAGGKTDTTSDLLGIIGRETENITDLPLYCEKGWTVRITGQAGITEDDYFVKFKPLNLGEPDPEDAETADDPPITEGRWVETVAPGSHTELDATTMPYQLTRRVDDDQGTWTGTPNKVYFEWNECEWEAREAGDIDSNPAPSFVGDTIREIFFHKGRMGFCSGDRVILSETNRYFNFFRTTVRSLIDSDPIDIGAGQNDVAFLNHVQMLGDDLFVFSDRDAFILDGTPTLTPATAALRPKVRHDLSAKIKPMPFGRSLMFFDSNSAFTKIRELYQTAGSDVDPKYDTSDVGVAIPKLIAGDPWDATACPIESVVAVVGTDDRNILHLYKYFQPGSERLQSSWSKWTFGGAKILGVNAVGSKLTVVLEKLVGASGNTCVTLETIELGDGLTDTNASFVNHIDSRIHSSNPDVSVVYSGGNTTWTLPDIVVTGAEYEVVTDGDATAGEGRYYGTTVNASAKTVQVAGVDLSTETVWIGIKYTASATPTRPIKRQQSLAGGLDFINEGRLQIHRATIVFSDTAEFDVEITPLNGTLVTTTYNDGKNTGAGATLNDGELDLGVQSKSAPGYILELKNSTPTPHNWLGVEYFCEHSPRYDRER